MSTDGTDTTGLPERIGDIISIVIIALIAAMFLYSYISHLVFG